MTDWLQGATRHYTDWVQEIDQTLLNVENTIRQHDIVVDFPWGGEFRLSSVVDGLRQGFELLFFQFPDSDLLRKQGYSLRDLHEEGQGLLKQYYASLLALPDVWQGPSAEAYVGPRLGAMSDTQMEAYDQAHSGEPQPEGWQLYANLNSMLAALDHNATTHHQLAQTFDQVREAQGGMRWMVVEGAASAAVMVAQPETAPVTLPDTAVVGEQVVEKTCFICKILPIFAIVAALAAAGGIYALVKSGIFSSPQNSGAPPRRLELADPLENLTPSQRATFKSLQHEFPGMDLELLALVRAGYGLDDIRRMLRNILAEMDRKGIRYNRQALLFAVVMPQNDWSPTQIVFLEQGNPNNGWYHILNGTGPDDPGHRGDFQRIFGLTTDDQIQWLIMDAVTTDTPVRFVPDPVHGGGAYTYVVTMNGRTAYLTVVIAANGYIITAYPTPTR